MKPYYETKLGKLYCGDCLEVMKGIESVDLVATDPPYFTVAEESWDNKWNTPEEYLKWMLEWTREVKRLLSDGGSLYVFGGIGPKNGFIFWDYVKEVSTFLTFASYINWRRFRGKGYRGLHNNWPDSREDIAYFVKGDKPRVFVKQHMREAGLSSTSKKRFEKTGVGLACTNIWIDIPEAQLDGGLNRTLEHPSQKPEKLMKRIILASSNKGDVILDPFIGSGTTVVACENLKRKWIGIEKEEKYCEVTKKRLKEIDDWIK